MISFASLIERVHTNILNKSKHKVEQEVVAKILQEQNVPTMLASDTPFPQSPQIVVKKFWMQGSKLDSATGAFNQPFSYSRTLAPGINGWIAGNSSGKSTILKLIVAAFTGTPPNLKHDVQSWISQVAVSFEVGPDQEEVTISYSPNDTRDISGAVYLAPIDSVIRGARELQAYGTFRNEIEMSRVIGGFFRTRLTSQNKDVLGSKSSNAQPRDIPFIWEIVGQSFFIGADDYHDVLFPRRLSAVIRHRETVLLRILGLPHLQTLTQLRSAADEAQRSLNLVRQRTYLEEAEFRSLTEEAQQQLNEVQQRIQEIDAGRSVLVEPDYVRLARERVGQLCESVSELTLQEQELQREITLLKATAGRIRREILRIKEVQKLRVFFSSVAVDRCPNCEQNVPQLSLEEEIASGSCRVCKNPLKELGQSESQEEKLALLQKGERNCTSSLSQMQRDRKRLSSKIDEVSQQISQDNTVIRDFARQAQQGFTVEYRQLLTNQGFFQGQLAQLSQQTPEKAAEQLRELQDRATVLQAALTIIEQDIRQSHISILRTLEEQTMEFARNFGIRGLNSINLNESFELVVQQGGKRMPYDELDISEMLRVKLAFHLALLAVCTQNQIGLHPRLLIIDAPGSAELDRVRFDAFIEGLIRLRDRLGTDVQILIATTKPELMDACGPGQAISYDSNSPIF